MSIEVTLARIAELQTAFAPPAPAPTQPAAFAGTLQQAQTQSGLGTPPTAVALPAAATVPAAQGGTGAGQPLLAKVQAEVGQAEQPPGSNDSPRIAQYRQATAGSGVGPWCAYFVSWAAREAGVPLGDQGQGFGRVDDVYAWAQRAGKALPAGSTPAPGDLIVWGSRHIGIVESVDADGSIHTIEGNSSDAVSRRTYGSDGGGATGYVRLG
jgi:hypothetical protein